jgi:hypothetical protein
VESSPSEGEGEWEEQRDGDGLRDGGNAAGLSLSTVHIAEQWRIQKTTKEKEGKEQRGGRNDGGRW